MQPEEYSSSILNIKDLAEIENPAAENKTKYSFYNGILNIKAKENIKKIAIYNLLGCKILDKEFNSKSISIPVKENIFIIKISYTSGTEETCKIL